MNVPNPSLPGTDWHTRTQDTSTSEVQVKRFRIEVVSGPDQGRTAVAEGDELCLGTAPTNHMVLSDPALSPHHLSIAATDAGFQLRDLGASGTCLAGYRVELAYIDSGALIQAGETTVRFDALDEQLAQPLSASDRFGDVLGQCLAMRRLFAELQRVSPGDTALLLEGEVGTGKGAMAEAIHRNSGRSGRPLVVIDCGATQPGTLASELFGHEGGAEERLGAFAAADGGTLYLDEIGALGPELQLELLRALESGSVQRVGGGPHCPSTCA